MPPSNDGRLSAVESDVKNIAKGIEDIKGFLYKTSERHTEIIGRLAVIDSKQDDFKEYTEKCELDRSQQEKRITKCENYQANQRSVAMGIAAVVSAAFTGAIEYFRR